MNILKPKYYYTDPLKASWMTVVLDVKYCSADGKELWCDAYNGCFWDGNEERYDKAYINSESEHIFKPIEGDIGINTDDEDGTKEPCQFIENNWVTGQLGEYYFCFGRQEIIQRDHKAFFMPKVEE
jgi:hypothetical protein